MTEKRAAILRILRESHGHLTADEIYTEARKEHPGMVLATVYNNLHALCEAGLVRRIRTEECADFYDRTPTEHDHAVCVKCGKIFDLPPADVGKFLRDTTGLEIVSYHLSVRAVCPECCQPSRRDG